MDHEQARGGETHRTSGVGLAVAYFGLVGLVGAALAAWFLSYLVTDLLSGYCEEVALCDHSLQDFIAPFVAAVAGITMLPTAVRLRHDPPQLGLIVGVGTVVGIAVAVLPIVLILLAADFSGSFNIFGSMLPTGLLLLPFVGLLLWAVASAAVVWRETARRRA